MTGLIAVKAGVVGVLGELVLLELETVEPLEYDLLKMADRRRFGFFEPSKHS